jgi:predicted amidohydrolase
VIAVPRCLALLGALLLWAGPACLAEDLHRITFDGPATEALFVNTWGDKPVEVLANGAEAESGRDGAGGRLRLQFGEDAANNLSYWTLDFPEPVPIVPQMEEIGFWVKANVPVSIKIPITPFGFIYHGPTVRPSEDWQEVKVAGAYAELKAWCARGEQDADFGLVPGVIVAIGGTKGALADVAVDDVAITGAEGAVAAAARELQQRRYRRVGVSVVTLPWSEEGRSLQMVLDRLDEAAQAGSDIVCLPMECVETEGEAIPGPLSEAIAARAAEHRMYVIGNLREVDGDRRYVTSFLCDRAGQIVGKYRKSHRMPDEDMDLGDDLPVFKTDFATIAMRIGSDRYFADIDHVYTAKGARMIFWSQQPEPVEDEYLQDMPAAGRAVDYNVFIACARYSFDAPGWITNMFPPYRGCPIGRSYVINREGQRVAATTRKGSVATAVIAFPELQGNGRGAHPSPAFSVLTEPVSMPEPREWAKRRIRVTAIENHVGIEDLLARLDEAGQMGSDIVCTYEFVWISGGSAEHVPAQTARAKENLRRIAEKAGQWNMYVLVAGVVDRLERNEAIVYGRDGEEVGRYFKVIQTHDEQVCGDETPIIETDFGRTGVRICADEALVELDRSYGVKGADIIFTPTQSWGPDALYRNLRDISRCMDAQVFHVQATHSCTEAMHRSVIIEPTGVPVARTQYRSNGLVTAVIDLDRDRPRRYVRSFRPHTPAGYLPEYQPTELPDERNDLKETILLQRRPDLYQVLAPKTP